MIKYNKYGETKSMEMPGSYAGKKPSLEEYDVVPLCSDEELQEILNSDSYDVVVELMGSVLTDEEQEMFG